MSEDNPTCEVGPCTNDAVGRWKGGKVCQYHYPNPIPSPPDEEEAPGYEHHTES